MLVKSQKGHGVINYAVGLSKKRKKKEVEIKIHIRMQNVVFEF